MTMPNIKIPAILKNKYFVLGIAIIIIAFAYFMIFGSKNGQTAKYTFAALTTANIESTISSSGTLNPVTEVTVGTQVSGTIEKVLVDFNDKVVKGQIIAVIDSSVLRMSVDDARSTLLKTEAQLEEAQANYDRSIKLFERNLISGSDFQTVKTTLKSAQAAMISAETGLKKAVQNLNYAIVRSPINGTVTSRSVEAGQTVAASFSTPTLFTIAQDLSKMEIKASVDESDIGQIKVGQAVHFTVQAYPTKTFEGLVRQVRLEPTTTSNVVNYTVVISAENKDNLLLPGMTATVEFVVAHKSNILAVSNVALRFQPTEKELAAAQKRMQANMPVLPADSLRTKPQAASPQNTNDNAEWKKIYFLDKDGNLTFAPILVGISDGTNTEIIGDHFSAGLKVITGTESATATAATSASKSKSSAGGPPPPMM
jgi:HlyD family secretion protein